MTYILCAEDDSFCMEMIRDTLEAQGFIVHTTDNGDDALKMALAEKPQLALLDVLMPCKSGLEVTILIKAHYGAEAPPVILVTALGSFQDIVRGRQAGADDYIIKPFTFDILNRKIRAALYGV